MLYAARWECNREFGGKANLGECRNNVNSKRNCY